MFHQGTPISQGLGEQLCGLASAHKLMPPFLCHGYEPPATPEARAEAPKSHRCNSKCHCTAPQCLGVVLPAVMYVTEISSSNVMSTFYFYFLLLRFLPLFFYDCIVSLLYLCMHFLKLNLVFIT